MTDLTVLLPDLRRASAAAQVRHWIARGDRLPDRAPGRDAALHGVFEFSGPDVPSAALTRSLEANDAAGAQWVRADPCYVAVDAVAVRLLAIGDVGLSEEESNELARALRPLFGDAGFPLEPAAAQRWYLRCPAGARLPRFTAPGDVIGDDLLHHLPTGENERQWRHLLNEAQVILHNHPLNARRAQRGHMPANSLWFWGGGELPPWARTTFTRVLSGDPIVHGLAKLAHVYCAAAGGARDIFHNDANAVLLDLRHAPGALEQDWFAPIADALRGGALGELTLRFESGEGLRYRRRHGWRFWRRVPGSAA